MRLNRVGFYGHLKSSYTVKDNISAISRANILQKENAAGFQATTYLLFVKPAAWKIYAAFVWLFITQQHSHHQIFSLA